MMYLTTLERTICVHCEDAFVLELLTACYGSMWVDQPCQTADLTYSVGRDKQTKYFVLSRKGQKKMYAADAGELLFLFDKDLTIALQRLRSDLYFIHAASLEAQGTAVMLVASSGSGKSTMAWALLHAGFRYLSDELSPIDLNTLTIHLFPHALCLKSDPPAPYQTLPKDTVRTSRTLHIPVNQLPREAAQGPMPLAVIFFLQYRPELRTPRIKSMSRATAAARLLANALNPLAHSGEGLEPAIRIAERSECYDLDSVDLPATCALIKDVAGV